MTNSNFGVFIEVYDPPALGRRLNLDALLGSIISDKCIAEGIEQHEAWHRGNTEIPLVHSHGVYCGSSAIIPECEITTRTLTGSLERHIAALHQPEDNLQKNEKKRSVSRAFDKVDKRYPNIMTTFKLYHINSVPNGGLTFIAHGDREKTEGLLNRIKVIGAKGFGRIKTVSTFDIQTGPYPGLLTAEGMVLRPVPCDSGIKPSQYKIAEETFQPPYFKGERKSCFVPPLNMWKPHDIDQLREGT